MIIRLLIWIALIEILLWLLLREVADNVYVIDFMVDGDCQLHWCDGLCLQFTDIFDQITAYAAGNPINVVNRNVLQSAFQQILQPTGT